MNQLERIWLEKISKLNTITNLTCNEVEFLKKIECKLTIDFLLLNDEEIHYLEILSKKFLS